MDKVGTSERISAFLDFLREAPAKYRMAQEDEMRSDKETQDILHWYEFDGWDATDAELLRVGRTLSLVRRRRRRAKDARSILHPVTEWTAKNESVQKSLERLLGDMRKAERGTENRHYTDRTDIMRVMLGALDDESGL